MRHSTKFSETRKIIAAHLDGRMIRMGTAEFHLAFDELKRLMPDRTAHNVKIALIRHVQFGGNDRRMKGS